MTKRKSSRSYLKAMRRFRSGGSKKRHAATRSRARATVRLPAAAAKTLRTRHKRRTSDKARRARLRNLKLARAARLGVKAPAARATRLSATARKTKKKPSRGRRASARIAQVKSRRVSAHSAQETTMAKRRRCKIRKTKGYRYRHPKSGKTVTVKHRARRVCRRHRVKSFTYTAPKRTRRISYRRKRPHRTAVSYTRRPKRVHVPAHLSYEQMAKLVASASRTHRRRGKRRHRKHHAAPKRMAARRRRRHSARSPMLTLAAARSLMLESRRSRGKRRSRRRRNPTRHHRRRHHRRHHHRRHHARSYALTRLPNPVYTYSMERGAHEFLANPLTGPELAFAFVAGGVGALGTDLLRRWFQTKDIAPGDQGKAQVALTMTPNAKALGVQALFVLAWGIGTAVSHKRGNGTASAIFQGGLLGSGLYVIGELLTIGVTKAFAKSAKVAQLYADVAIANAAAPQAGLSGLPQGPVAGLGASAGYVGPSTVTPGPGQFWMPPPNQGGPVPQPPVPIDGGGGGCNPCNPCGDQGQGLINTIAANAMPVASAQGYAQTMQQALDTAQQDLCGGDLAGAPKNGAAAAHALGFFGD